MIALGGRGPGSGRGWCPSLAELAGWLADSLPVYRQAAPGLPLFGMPEVDLQSNGVGAEVEVKKLQELVRKLEQQNERLRSRAGPQLQPASPEETLQYFLAHAGGGQDTEDGSQASVLDQLELLDLSSLSCWDESEETW